MYIVIIMIISFIITVIYCQPYYNLEWPGITESQRWHKYLVYKYKYLVASTSTQTYH